MKKTNNKINYAKMISISLCVLAAISFTACTKSKKDDTKEIMNIDLGEEGMTRNGTEHYTYQVEEGQKGIISIDISRESGQLDIDVYRVDSKEDPDYRGRNLDSASFDVIVEKPGEYEVYFTAADFVGDYKVGFRIEDTTEKQQHMSN